MKVIELELIDYSDRCNDELWLYEYSKAGFEEALKKSDEITNDWYSSLEFDNWAGVVDDRVKYDIETPQFEELERWINKYDTSEDIQIYINVKDVWTNTKLDIE